MIVKLYRPTPCGQLSGASTPPTYNPKLFAICAFSSSNEAQCPGWINAVTPGKKLFAAASHSCLDAIRCCTRRNSTSHARANSTKYFNNSVSRNVGAQGSSIITSHDNSKAGCTALSGVCAARTTACIAAPPTTRPLTHPHPDGKTLCWVAIFNSNEPTTNAQRNQLNFKL